MPVILPAGKHYGTALQKWTSGETIVSRIQYAGDSTIGQHGNERASLLFVEAGGCVKKMGPQVLELNRDAALFLPAGHLQEDKFVHPTTFLSVDLGQTFVDLLHETHVLNNPLEILGSEASNIRLRVEREMKNPDAFSALVIEGAILGLLASEQRAKNRSVTDPPLWVKRVKESLYNTSQEVPTLTSVAISAGVHPAHLYKEFKRWFHCTPGDYVRRCRVETAKDELKRSERPISEIALATGFSDQAHLTKSFKKETGFTPRAYRLHVRGTAPSTPAYN